MSVYQDVVAANLALAAWALTEASGLAFVPYIGGSNLVGSGAFDYQQAGPAGTDFGLRSHVGAKTTLTFVTVVNPPVTTECWIKVSNITPAATCYLIKTGNNGVNGIGFYLATNGHLHLELGGVQDIDTLITWPDTNWHLLQLASSQLGQIETVGFDGVVRYRSGTSTPTAPTPNTLTFTGSSANTATQLVTIAWPAFYAYEMSPANMAATYLALTNPTAALVSTVTGGGAQAGAPSDALSKILSYVSRTYQNAP